VTRDIVGNITSVDGPLPGSADTTHYRYDASRRLLATVGPDPDGSKPLKHRMVETEYDAAGLPITVYAGVAASPTEALERHDSMRYDYDAQAGHLRATLEQRVWRSQVTTSRYADGAVECVATA
jgi:hypothetical protein